MQVFRPEQWHSNKIKCFTTSVYGGYSKHNYQSLNVGAHVGDIAEDVSRNRQVLTQWMQQQFSQHFHHLKWLNQQHTNNVCNYEDSNASPCDGVYTSQALTPLVVMTADCMPIVLMCEETNQIAVVHAGWRGLLGGVIENALDQFKQTKSIKVWIGPSISKQSFEVSDDVIDLFSNYKRHITALDSHKYSVDLPQIAKNILDSEGVLDLEISPICTYQNKSCFSHRRAMHEGLANTGRMATVVLRLA